MGSKSKVGPTALQVYTWHGAAAYKGEVRDGLRHGCGRLVLAGGAASDAQRPCSTPASPAEASQASHAEECESGTGSIVAAAPQQSCTASAPAAEARATGGSPADSAQCVSSAGTCSRAAVQTDSTGLPVAASMASACCSPADAVDAGERQAGAEHNSTCNTPGGCTEYDGGWRAGERHGRGRLRYAAAAGGGEYEGAWLHDVRHGVGRMVR